MKVSRSFIKFFLTTFLLVIILTILSYFTNFYTLYMYYLSLIYVVILIFLILRKKVKSGLKFIGAIIIIGLVVLLGYYIWSNFLIEKSHNYFYDVGGSEDIENLYLTPSSRISKVFNETIDDNTTLTYRNLLSQLVYFGVSIPWGSDIVNIDMKIKNQFSRNDLMFIGAGTSKDWNYTSHLVYNRTLFKNTADEWIIVSTKFNISNLYTEKGILVLLIDIPHLAEDYDEDRVIPVDWINITLTKKSLFNFKNSMELNASSNNSAK